MIFAEWFVFMSMGWWILTGTAIIASLIAIANESFWFNTFLVAYILIMYFCGNSQWFLGIHWNWVTVIVGIIVYIIIGILWSLFKTNLYVRDQVDIRIDYEGNTNDLDWYSDKFGYQVWPRVIYWTANWPVSSIFYLLTRFLGDVWNGIMNRFKGLYKNIYLTAIETKRQNALKEYEERKKKRKK